MARPTTDPRPHVLSLRLGDADRAALDELADDLGASRSEAGLAALRGFLRRKAAPRRAAQRGRKLVADQEAVLPLCDQCGSTEVVIYREARCPSAACLHEGEWPEQLHEEVFARVWEAYVARRKGKELRRLNKFAKEHRLWRGRCPNCGELGVILVLQVGCRGCDQVDTFDVTESQNYIGVSGGVDNSRVPIPAVPKGTVPGQKQDMHPEPGDEEGVQALLALVQLTEKK